ncbi:MMPL family transporter [Nocardioides sp.]|uniref:MMPL family transporter n=1 Tax=Nocardioides sp. TaxID=35761 RepID=UPI003219AC8E
MSSARRRRLGHLGGRVALRRLGGLCAVGLLAVLMVMGLGKVRLETSLESFLPTGEPDLTAYERNAADFGGDPVVVLLEADDDRFFDGERLASTLRLEGSLATLDHVAGVYGPATLLNQIAGRAQDLLSELLGRRDAEVALARSKAAAAGASPSEIRRAGEEATARFDARYGPLLVSGLPGGLPTLENQRFVDQVVFGSAGRPRGQWRFVVPSAASASILIRPEAGLDADEAAELTADVERVVAGNQPDGTQATVSGSPVLLTALSERTTSDAVRLGALAVAGVGLCFLLATFIRRSRRLAPLATTLIAVAGAVSVVGWSGRPVSIGVVAFCSVLLGIGCYYPTYYALGARVRTVLVVALATATSLGTLVLSPLPLVQDLGLTMAVGVLLSALLALPLRPWLRSGSAEESSGAAETADPAGPSSTWRTPRTRRFAVATALAGALAVVGWALLPHLSVESDVDHFAGGLPALDDADHVEDVIGSSGELSVVLRGSDVLSPESLTWTRDSVRSVVADHGGQMRPVLSTSALLAFLGDAATVGQTDAAMRILPEYLTDAVVTSERTTSAASFGVSLRDLSELRTTLEEVRADLPAPPAGAEVEITGLPIVLLRAEQLVSDDRVPANVLGILSAGLVLLVGLRRRSDALRAVVAAAVATGLGFFLVDLLGIALNPVTVALGALTAAVGCEFTVVQAEAVRRGSSVLGKAVGLVTATSVVGYLALLGSGLEAVRGFGALLAGAVLIAAFSSWLVVGASVRRPVVAPRASGEQARHDASPAASLEVTHA